MLDGLLICAVYPAALAVIFGLGVALHQPMAKADYPEALRLLGKR